MRASIQRITLAAFLLTACKSAPTDSVTGSATATAAATGSASATGTGAGTATVAARPLYYERTITPADLEGRTLRELTLMRNTIYARTGNVFRKAWLHDYFAEQDWYKPSGLDESKLSAVDRANAEVIAKYETALPRAELERKRKALADRHAFASDPEGWAATVAISADGALVATGGEVVDLWDRNGARLKRLSPPIDEESYDDWAVTLAFSADARTLAVRSEGGAVRVFDTKSGKLLPKEKAKLTEPEDVVTKAPSADGTRVAEVVEGRIRVLDAKTGAPVPEWKGHEPFTSEEDRIELILLSRALGVPNTAGEENERSPLDDVNLLDEPVTVAHLKDMSRRDLRILRNTVYARRGRAFQSPLLQQHFGRMDWYKPDAKYTDARLTAQDKRNIKVIQSVEAEVGGPLSDLDQQLFEGA